MNSLLYKSIIISINNRNRKLTLTRITMSKLVIKCQYQTTDGICNNEADGVFLTDKKLDDGRDIEYFVNTCYAHNSEHYEHYLTYFKKEKFRHTCISLQNENKVCSVSDCNNLQTSKIQMHITKNKKKNDYNIGFCDKHKTKSLELMKNCFAYEVIKQKEEPQESRIKKNTKQVFDGSDNNSDDSDEDSNKIMSDSDTDEIVTGYESDSEPKKPEKKTDSKKPEKKTDSKKSSNNKPEAGRSFLPEAKNSTSHKPQSSVMSKDTKSSEKKSHKNPDSIKDKNEKNAALTNKPKSKINNKSDDQKPSDKNKSKKSESINENKGSPIVSSKKVDADGYIEVTGKKRKQKQQINIPPNNDLSKSPQNNKTYDNSPNYSNKTGKEKTLLCSYHAKGKCRYGSKCSEAHGVDDQKKLSLEENKRYREDNYKTTDCEKYDQVGFCEFGINCLFAHGASDRRKLQVENEYYDESQVKMKPICEKEQSQNPCYYGALVNSESYKPKTDKEKEAYKYAVYHCNTYHHKFRHTFCKNWESCKDPECTQKVHNFDM